MFEFLSPSTSSTPAQASRRQFMRHSGSGAHVSLMGEELAVLDWSLGGAQIQRPVQRLGIEAGGSLDLPFTFHFIEGDIDVTIDGVVMRGDQECLSFRFAPLTEAQENALRRAQDFRLAEDFLQSQAEFSQPRRQ